MVLIIENKFVQVRRARDACILLAGQKPYRYTLLLFCLCPLVRYLSHLSISYLLFNHVYIPHIYYVREFPLEWMTRHLEKSNFDVLHTATFSILHSEDSISRQVKVAELKLDYMADSSLRGGMQSYLDGLK